MQIKWKSAQVDINHIYYYNAKYTICESRLFSKWKMCCVVLICCTDQCCSMWRTCEHLDDWAPCICQIPYNPLSRKWLWKHGKRRDGLSNNIFKLWLWIFPGGAFFFLWCLICRSAANTYWIQSGWCWHRLQLSCCRSSQGSNTDWRHHSYMSRPHLGKKIMKFSCVIQTRAAFWLPRFHLALKSAHQHSISVKDSFNFGQTDCRVVVFPAL